MVQASVALCPVCGNLAELGPGPARRPRAACRRCSSLERHRALAGLLPGLRKSAAQGTLVDVAPSRQTSRLLRAFAADLGVAYVGMDFDPGADNRIVTLQASLTQLPLRDASVGLLICFHVLEHIPDDAAAMAEISRVLAPGGVAVVQVPRRKGVPTDEDPDAPVEERVHRFGQSDHVRFYGDDFEDRLRAAGLKVHAITMRDLYRPIESDLLGVEPDEPLWLCTTDIEVEVEALAEECAASARAAAVAALEGVVADRQNATARARRLTGRVVKLRTRVQRERSRARRAERAQRKAEARLKQLRSRPDIRVTNAVAHRINRLAGRIRPGPRQVAATKEPAPTAPVDETALLKASPVFDLAWYEREAGRSFAGLDEAVAHYRQQGRRPQLSPHPLFEPTTADNSTGGLTPVGAYLTSPHGAAAVAPPRLGRRGLPPPRARCRRTPSWAARPPRGATHRRDRDRRPRSDRPGPGALGRGAGLAGRGPDVDGTGAADAPDLRRGATRRHGASRAWRRSSRRRRRWSRS